MTDMEFTQKADKIRSSMMESFDEQAAICFEDRDREEAERLIHIIKHADADERVPNLAKLKKMCLAYGIDIKELLANPQKMLEKIPSKQQVIDIMLEYFYRLYQTAPTPERNMERITNTLIKQHEYPEFENTNENEPVRTKILRRFTAGSRLKWKTFKMDAVHQWAFDKMADCDKERYNRSNDTEKSLTAAKYLDDRIFEEKLGAVNISPADMIKLMGRFGWDMEKSAKNEPLENDKKFTDIEFDKSTRTDIETFCRDNGILPEGNSNLDFVCAVADSIGSTMTSEEFGMKSAFFWERLEKQFDDTMSKVRYTPEKSKKAGELYSAHDKWSDRKRDFIRASNKEWEILDFCDNMAKGNFFTDRRINRRNLYYYAIMFDMTCDFGVISERDEKTDISKNLFEDFYCDNMARYLDGKTTSNEAEPSGEGINYKNFTDVIYLYYLSHKELGSNGERIDNAEKLIGRCIRHREYPDRENIRQDYMQVGATYRFRTKYTNEVLDRKPADLESYIISHFLIPERIADTMPEVDISNTANENIDELMNEIDEIWQTVTGSNLYRYSEGNEKEEYSLDHVLAFNKTLGELLKKKYSSDDDFIRTVDTILKRIDSFEDIMPYNELKADCLKILYLMYDPVLKENFMKMVSGEFGSDISSALCSKAIKDLQNAGFDIIVSTQTSRKKEKDKETKRKTGTFYRLNKRNYPDNEMLQNVIDCMKQPRRTLIESIRQLNPPKRKISRSRLLAAVADHYILGINPLIQAEEDFEEFPYFSEQQSETRNILDLFCLTADEILAASNFQPVSPKNLFDMYLFLSALYYFRFEIQ